VDAAIDGEAGAVRLETERLVLRSLRLSDFDDYFAVSADPETFRFSERGAMSSDEAWTRLLRHAGHWSLLGYGLFALEEKETGRFVGEAGLGDFHRGLGPAYEGVPEAAWTVAPWAQGRGYATEAAAAAIEWMERTFAVERSVCLIHAGNTASLHVAGKLGYCPFAQRSYRGYPAVLHQRTRRASRNADIRATS
jgi:RimJ/RimL family protein N-acetyltransferase